MVTAPLLDADGTFSLRESGRKIRIYKGADVRMMLSDTFTKLQLKYERQISI